VLFLLLVAPVAAAQQPDSTILRRWVGNYNERPLTIEFYGDTMLVVGDRHALSYRMTYDSIIATGDTSLVVRYRLSYGRLLLETADGNTITMAKQETLGRPLTGRWLGEIDTAGAAAQPAEVVLTVDRVARWRTLPDGKLATGEWERQTRVVTLTWEDSEWTGLYDPQRNTLLLEPVADSTKNKKSAAGVLRRVFRSPPAQPSQTPKPPAAPPPPTRNPSQSGAK